MVAACWIYCYCWTETWEYILSNLKLNCTACLCQQLYWVPVVCVYAKLADHKNTNMDSTICCYNLLIHTSHTVAPVCATSLQSALVCIVYAEMCSNAVHLDFLFWHDFVIMHSNAAFDYLFCKHGCFYSREELHAAGVKSKAYQALSASFLGQLSIEGFQVFV